MKRYEYVNIEQDVPVLYTSFKSHRKIIDEYALKGFSYVGYIPTDINAHGKIKSMDLIFEIEDN